MAIYGHQPRPGGPVSEFPASYPLPAVRFMAAGAKQAIDAAAAADALRLKDNAASFWIREFMESSDFRAVAANEFKKSSHINVQEGKAYRTVIKIASKRHQDSRLVTLLDSRVNIGAWSKGRFSSEAISAVQQGAVPFIIGAGLYPANLHAPTDCHRADEP